MFSESSREFGPVLGDAYEAGDVQDHMQKHACLVG